MTLDLQKSWSWASNRELLNELQVEDLPKQNVLTETRHADALHRLRQLSKLHLPLSDKLHLAVTSVLPKWGYSCEVNVLDWKELNKLQRTIVDSVWKLSINGSPPVFFA